MKLIVKDYIASLNEEVGLNELIPKLLLFQGYTVINNAQKGVRQAGVDILAEKNGNPYLVTIKQGDITRANWDSGENALRQSLNDIIDTYIQLNLPQKYKDKKITIIIVYNGYVDQSLQNSVTGYEKRNSVYEFVHWNIDYLTKLVSEHLLNENIMSKSEMSHMRKCLSLINEKDFKLSVYKDFVNELLSPLIGMTSKKLLNREINKIIIVQKIICEWDNSSNVYINKIKCCEILLLRITSKLLSFNKNKKMIEMLYNSLLDIYLEMMDKYFENAKILKNSNRMIQAFDDIGHRIKLFEIMGILSLYGVILMKIYNNTVTLKIKEIHDLIINILDNYSGLLYIPLESNCTEVSLFLLFLTKIGDIKSAKNYVQNLLEYQGLVYKKYNRFPFPYDDYYEAITNSRTHKTKFTSSLVIENLYEWFVILEEEKASEDFLLKINEYFENVSFQLWSFNNEEEIQFYDGDISVGTTYIFPQFKSTKIYKKQLKEITKNIIHKLFVSEKKNIDYISLIASRNNHMPINPYLYLNYLK